MSDTLRLRILKWFEARGDGAKCCVVAKALDAPYSTVHTCLCRMEGGDIVKRSGPDKIWTLIALPMEGVWR